MTYYLLEFHLILSLLIFIGLHVIYSTYIKFVLLIRFIVWIFLSEKEFLVVVLIFIFWIILKIFHFQLYDWNFILKIQIFKKSILITGSLGEY